MIAFYLTLSFPFSVVFQFSMDMVKDPGLLLT